MTIAPGTTLRCDESQTDREPSGTELWPDYPNFSAVVDSVQGDYVEATVTMGNSHPRTPENGAELALSRETIQDDGRWSIKCDPEDDA